MKAWLKTAMSWLVKHRRHSFGRVVDQVLQVDVVNPIANKTQIASGDVTILIYSDRISGPL